MQLCNEFMQALAYTGLKHSAMYPVYGLAEACLAVTFPEPDADYRWIRANRHKLGIGSVDRDEPRRCARRHRADVRRARSVPNTELRIADDAARGGSRTDKSGTF